MFYAKKNSHQLNISVEQFGMVVQSVTLTAGSVYHCNINFPALTIQKLEQTMYYIYRPRSKCMQQQLEILKLQFFEVKGNGHPTDNLMTMLNQDVCDCLQILLLPEKTAQGLAYLTRLKMKMNQFKRELNVTHHFFTNH